MHMHKEGNDAAHVQKSCNMCLFTSHMPCVLKNDINRKHLGILKRFECNKWDFSAKTKCVLKYHEHLIRLQDIQCSISEESYASFRTRGI